MINLKTAIELKEAGLQWRPALHDFFAIPDHDMDERLFVISDMLATMDLIQGFRMISFQGASEWALDSVIFDEVVWMPSEEQLRQAVEERLLKGGHSGLRLIAGRGGYRCEIPSQDGWQVFEAKDASDAYAYALLAMGLNHNI